MRTIRLKKARRLLGVARHMNLLPGGKHVLVACMPGSGSTFLIRVLARITGFDMHPLVYACEENEQDLYLPVLIDSRR